MSSFLNSCSDGNWCMFESHALPESGIGYPVPFFPPTFSKSNLSDSPYTFHFFKVLLWSVEVLGRMGDSLYSCPVVTGEISGLIFYWVWILKLLIWIGWEGHFHMSTDDKFFLSFKQFALCLCSIPSLGAEHSAHWGSWSLVSRGLIKKIFHNMGDGEKVF